MTELNAMRALWNERLDTLAAAVERDHAPIPPSVTGGLRANLMRRLDRFERRLIAAAKREHSELMEEIATARGSLFPFGTPQERILNFVPFLARYGPLLQAEMRSEARRHASWLTGSDQSDSASRPARQPAERAP
jgi:hypothetical protein